MFIVIDNRSIVWQLGPACLLGILEHITIWFCLHICNDDEILLYVHYMISQCHSILLITFLKTVYIIHEVYLQVLNLLMGSKVYVKIG